MRKPRALESREDKLSTFIGKDAEELVEPRKSAKFTLEPNLDDTPDSEKPVNVNMTEYYRAAGDQLVKVMPEIENRKQLLKIIIRNGMDALIEKHLNK